MQTNKNIWKNVGATLERAAESKYPSECKIKVVICEKHGNFPNKKALHLEYNSNPMADNAPCFI